MSMLIKVRILKLSILFISLFNLFFVSNNQICWSEESRESAISTIRDFGAVGDGKHDDTQAIQRAVDAEIGEIRFTRGVYKISSPIIIDLDRVGQTSIFADGPATLLMIGSGPALKWIGTHEGTASPDTVKNNVWQNQRNPMILGLEIVGKHPESIGISLEGTMQATISRVSIRQAKHGIHLTKRNRNVIISDCHVYDNTGIGIFLDHVNLHQINITNSHISYNDGGGIVVRDSEVRNLQIGVCDIESNMDHESPPTANILIDASSGSVREGAIIGCTIQHNHVSPDSANIRFIGQSKENPIKAGNFVVSDNVLSDVFMNIHIQNSRGIVINSNTFWKSYSYNVLVEGSSNIVMGPNLLDRNPDYKDMEAKNGLLFRDSTDCSLNGLHINQTMQAKGGLILQNCSRFNITNCTILDCKDSGLWMDEVENIRVSDCLINNRIMDTDQTFSLKLIQGNGNMIIDNLLGNQFEIAPDSAFLSGNHTIKP